MEEVASGAFASDALREASSKLSARDAGLANQIVLGCLRVQNRLDYLIEIYSGRSPAALDLPVLIALRAAIYQIRYLDRIPPHAAVHDSVEFVKHSKWAASGLTNAVLRKAGKEKIAWPTESLECACPQWLLDRWAGHFGREQAVGIAKAAMEEPQRYVRIEPGTQLPVGVDLEATELPGCYRLLSAMPDGWRLHDIGSQAMIQQLELQAGHTYLDVCAAPGNKTLQAMETPLQLAVACDISEKRIRTLPAACHRIVLDATQSLPFSYKFERIFVDAPCSGTGTLARNPEIKWRLQPDDLARFKYRQLSILHQAIGCLGTESCILYATCSLEDEETRQVIAQTLKANSNLYCKREVWRVPGGDEGDGFYAALLCSKSV